MDAATPRPRLRLSRKFIRTTFGIRRLCTEAVVGRSPHTLHLDAYARRVLDPHPLEMLHSSNPFLAPAGCMSSQSNVRRTATLVAIALFSASAAIGAQAPTKPPPKDTVKQPTS